MAVAPTGAGGVGLQRLGSASGGLPSPAPTAFTIMGWFRGDGTTLHLPEPFDIFDSSGFRSHIIDVEHWASPPPVGDFLTYSGYDGTTFISPRGVFDLTAAQLASVWIHVAFVWTAAAGGTGTIYLTTEDHTENLAADLTFTFDPLLTNWDEVDINCSPHGGMTNVKVWTVALTPTQIAQERDAYAITNTTGIYSATNLSNDLDTADASGQNHPFAVLVGFQTVPGPAVLGGGGGTIPNTPTDVALDMSAFEATTITWSDNSTNEDGFHVQISVDNVVWGITHITGPNVTSLVLPVSPDQLYFARVSAFNATGESTFAVAGPAHSRQNLSIRLTSGPRSYLTIPDTPLAQSRTLAVGGASPQAIADTNGNLTCEAYIRLDNTGSATIYSTIRHRAWPFQDDFRKTLPIPPPGLPPNVPPSGDTWEWAYLNPLFSYWWFGVRNGRLVCEVQDGRVTGYITSGPNPGGPSDITLSPAGGSGCVVLDAGPLFGNVQPSAQFPPFSGTWHDCVSQWYIGIPPIFGIDPNVPPNCDFGFPALSAARDAQVGSYEIIYLTGLPEPCFSIGSPTETTLSCDERPGFPAQTTQFYSAYPVGFGMPSVPPPGTSYAQKVTLTGPVIPVGKWTRVAWRWVTLTTGPLTPQIASSTLELWVGCEKMASTTIPVNSRSDGYSKFFLPYANITVSPDAIGPGTRTVFVGGIPNPTLLAGQAATAISLYDFKLFLGNPSSNPGGISEAHMAAECDCTAGQQPALWWKLRDATDLTNFGADTPGAGLAGHPVGDTPIDGAVAPKNPCNILENVPGPPQPPPSQHFRAAASIGLGGATPTTGCAVDDQKL
jgi:hypothetical protein